MTIKDKICQSGGKQTTTGRYINEDRLTNFSVKHNNKQYEFIVIMDGVTGLVRNYEIEEGLTSAEWYVDFMIKEIEKNLLINPTIPLDEMLETCIKNAADVITNFEENNNITLKEYETPSACLTLLRTNGETTDLYLIGDTQTIIGYKNGVVTNCYNPNQEALQKLDNSVLKRMAELAKEKGISVLDTRTNPEIETMLKVNRSKKNADCEGAYWVLGTTCGSTKHGVTVTLKNSELDGILLATDGFDYSMLKLDTKEAYELVKVHGVNEVSKRIRIAQDNDPKCNMYPRFKKGDDLAAIFIEI